MIDFHNYGYTILRLSVRNAIILKLAYFYEKLFGRLSKYAFCVSKAMQKDLRENWRIKADVLYDKANTELFRPIEDVQEKHEIFTKLKLLPQREKINEGETAFTRVIDGKVEYKKDRPFLVISSTSWTKDEDFGILFNAMEQYEEVAKENPGRYAPLFLIITGKGPEKEKYLDIIASKEKDWEYIRIQTVWLEANMYPLLLASADLGVCLHYSSSGVDLPMKVVDMFGAGIPVLAIKYKSIHELVEHEKNGYIFNDTEELFNRLCYLFKTSGSTPGSSLQTLRANVKKFRDDTFDDEWKQVVLPKVRAVNEIKKIKQQKLISIFCFGDTMSHIYDAHTTSIQFLDKSKFQQVNS
eukprot:TRINITY_DN2454_c0_g1_i2.p1 TRINITY_DN2454_c0_g1~~TRINITY_DN2454_c0_g1_i2.p1  ORF type:complete len:354 (-),score=46.77 TRINITY_DN2454_c0_g1_i2:1404-2465(-)